MTFFERKCKRTLFLIALKYNLSIILDIKFTESSTFETVTIGRLPAELSFDVEYCTNLSQRTFLWFQCVSKYSWPAVSMDTSISRPPPYVLQLMSRQLSVRRLGFGFPNIVSTRAGLIEDDGANVDSIFLAGA